ncbi:MAG: hypothetical protein KAU20_05770 [Nanoarchaeota archaeon]|nr:hypothetical protein [Nanoarchaeota archaeon]
MNLLIETLQILEKNGKTEKDVKWIGNNNFHINFLTFKKFANEDYDNGYGRVEVTQSLVVVGDDWWLERYTYDGAEQWTFKTYPNKQRMKKKTREALNANMLFMGEEY